jgi:hypothetical protein
MTELVEYQGYAMTASIGEKVSIYSATGFVKDAVLQSVTNTDDGKVYIFNTQNGAEAILEGEFLTCIEVTPIGTKSITPAMLTNTDGVMVMPLGVEQVNIKC